VACPRLPQLPPLPDTLSRDDEHLIPTNSLQWRYPLNDTNITAVITIRKGTGNTTKAALRMFRAHYPKLRVIFAGTHTVTPDLPNGAVYIKCFNQQSEECARAAAALVDTEFILFMDNCAKVTGAEALPLLVDSFDYELQCACSGAYAYKYLSAEPLKVAIGTNFSGHCYVDGFSEAFSLHRTDCYREVGGLPPDGDIGRLYTELGYECVTPKRAVPVILNRVRLKHIPRGADIRKLKVFDVGIAE
jgi:hypothetical protein